MTSFEVWRYLTVAEGNANEKDMCGFGNVLEALESNELKRHIETCRGFYFLKGRRDLVEKRLQNDKNSIRKYKLAEKIAWWLRFVPFVRVIALTGTMAMRNTEKRSDVDFFVILKEGRIFTGRLLVTLATHVLGRRRYGKKIKNRICLNYFITTGNLEIKRQDLFAANEYSFIYPIFSYDCGHGRLDIFRQFCENNLEWIKKFKPNWEIPDLKPAKYHAKHSRTSRVAQKTGENLINLIFSDRMEAWQRKRQIERIKKNPLTYAKGGYVEYSDDNLIFLPKPQAQELFGEFKRRIEELNPAETAYDESFG